MVVTPSRADDGDRTASSCTPAVAVMPPEECLDALVRAVALACDVPFAGLTLIDQDRACIAAGSGSPDLADALGRFADRGDAPPGDAMMEVPDTTDDPRFRAHPAVTAAPHVRFFAGVTLHLGDGRAAGMLAVIDQRPRRLTEAQRETLGCLAIVAAQALEHRRARRLRGGQPVALRVTEDVTPGRRATQALTTGHRRLADILDSTGIGTWEWNVQTAALRVNERWAGMLGATIEDLAPLSDQTWREMIHPDDAARVAAHRAQHLAGEVADYDSEFRVRHRNGRWVWMHERGAIATRTADGRPEWVFGIRQDITLRKRQEEALCKSEEFLDRTGCAAGVGGWELDLLTGELHWSAETYRIIGAPPEYQPTLQAMIEMYAPEAQPVIRGAIAHSIATGEGFDLELAFIRRDGRQIWVRAVAVATCVDGRPVCLSGAFQDITESITREAALQAAEATLAANNARLERLARHLAVARDAAEQANAAKSRFLTGITHELRTPLNGILGYAQLLRLEGGLTAQQASRVQTMLDAGAHLLGMINAVLELSQIEADRIELHAAEIDLAALAQSCLNVIRPVAEAKGIGIGLRIDAAAPVRLLADPTRLRQVLVNLLGNAAKFTRAGRVELRLRPGRTTSGVRIEVADTGPGIPPAERGRLFREFERLQAAAAPAPVEGSGLGLAITARLTRRMGGQIGHADHPGGGSIFWIDLPLHAEPGEMAAPERTADIAAAVGLRILVVDDVAMNLDIAAAFLRLGGHDVVCVDNGSAAIAAVAADAFDVVLMDVRMPGMDGLETTRRIRGLPAPAGSVPIVAMTAQAFAEQIEKCRAAGMDSHVSKPLQQPTLLAAVAAYAGRRSAAAAPPDPAADPEPMLQDLDEATFQATAAVLRREDLEGYMRTLIDRGQVLLARLRAPGMRGEAAALAEIAHALGGSGSMFGLQRLADAARQFERAVEATPSELDASAAHLAAATAPAMTILQDLIDGLSTG